MRNRLLGSCLALALATIACQDQPTETTQPPAGTGAEPSFRSTLSAPFGLKKGRGKLPPSIRVSDQHVGGAFRRAINPDDYVCPASTPVIDFYIDEVTEVIVREPSIFNLLYNVVWADVIPTYEAVFLLTDDTPQEFGYSGEYTNVMKRTHRDAKRFWDIRSDDIQLVAMKGSMLLDTERVAETYQLRFVPPFFGLSEADASFVASLIRDALLQSVTLDGGDHPLFSFNAFAFSTDDGSYPDKIVMGDGILAGYAAVGFGDVAPQALYAHEFAHHIQFENGYFEDPVPGATTEAELTRYTELMADAYSAYYLTHKRGAAMNRKRVEQFLQVFFQIGDCAFDNPGHHGTPNQRMAAARFGFELAAQAQKQGHILTSERVHQLFVAAYPGLVAPDAT